MSVCCSEQLLVNVCQQKCITHPLSPERSVSLANSRQSVHITSKLTGSVPVPTVQTLRPAGLALQALFSLLPPEQQLIWPCCQRREETPGHRQRPPPTLCCCLSSQPLHLPCPTHRSLRETAVHLAHKEQRWMKLALQSAPNLPGQLFLSFVISVGTGEWRGVTRVRLIFLHLFKEGWEHGEARGHPPPPPLIFLEYYFYIFFTFPLSLSSKIPPPSIPLVGGRPNLFTDLLSTLYFQQHMNTTPL